MATVAVTSASTLCSEPLFVRKLSCTTGTTAAALTHGGPAVTPDLVVYATTNANPTQDGVSVTAKSTTTVTVDCEDDGNDTFDLYVIWFSKHTGGVS